MSVKNIALLLEMMGGSSKAERLREAIKILESDYSKEDLELVAGIVNSCNIEPVDIQLAIGCYDSDPAKSRRFITGPTGRGTGFGALIDLQNTLGEAVALRESVMVEAEDELPKAPAEWPMGGGEDDEGGKSLEQRKEELEASWDKFAGSQLGMGGRQKEIIDIGTKNIKVSYDLPNGTRYYEAKIDDEGEWLLFYQCFRLYKRTAGGIKKD